MNKKLNYLLEYLAKSQDIYYKDILDFFAKNDIYTPTKYDAKTIQILANKSGFDIQHTKMENVLKDEFDDELLSAKKQLFDTIIKTNFKKKKEEFDKVETSIYKCLSAYISGLTIAFELFILYDKEQPPEMFIAYANTLHVKLVDTIFNAEEKVLLNDKLKEIMIVYLTLYAKYLYV